MAIEFQRIERRPSMASTISEILRLQAENERLRAEIKRSETRRAAMGAETKRLKAEKERLLTKSAALEAKKERLEARRRTLERRVGLHSSNSGKPPAPRRTKVPRSHSGGQPAHKGATLR